MAVRARDERSGHFAAPVDNRSDLLSGRAGPVLIDLPATAHLIRRIRCRNSRRFQISASVQNGPRAAIGVRLTAAHATQRNEDSEDNRAWVWQHAHVSTIVHVVTGIFSRCCVR